MMGWLGSFSFFLHGVFLGLGNIAWRLKWIITCQGRNIGRTKKGRDLPGSHLNGGLDWAGLDWGEDEYIIRGVLIAASQQWKAVENIIYR